MCSCTGAFIPGLTYFRTGSYAALEGDYVHVHHICYIAVPSTAQKISSIRSQVGNLPYLVAFLRDMAMFLCLVDRLYKCF